MQLTLVGKTVIRPELCMGLLLEHTFSLIIL
jgi:hypothetical protein